jgi:hypothetical protein
MKTFKKEKPENTPKKRRESFCKFRGCKEVPVREVTSRQKNCEKGTYKQQQHQSKMVTSSGNSRSRRKRGGGIH